MSSRISLEFDETFKPYLTKKERKEKRRKEQEKALFADALTLQEYRVAQYLLFVLCRCQNLIIVGSMKSTVRRTHQRIPFWIDVANNNNNSNNNNNT